MPTHFFLHNPANLGETLPSTAASQLGAATGQVTISPDDYAKLLAASQPKPEEKSGWEVVGSLAQQVSTIGTQWYDAYTRRQIAESTGQYVAPIGSALPAGSGVTTTQRAATGGGGGGMGMMALAALAALMLLR